jgi:hypothetical protein
MTKRPFDSRHSGEIMRDGQLDGTGEKLPRGLLAVVQHARQLTRSPAREVTERLGRDRLLAAASMQPRPASAKNPFGGRGVWARLRAASRFETWHAWSAVAAVACLAVLGYTLLPMSLGTSSTLLNSPGLARSPSAPLAAAGVLPSDQPLTYSTSGGQPSASNYLVAPAHASANLRFSDGSDVAASPSARLRVDSVQARGARVLLEDGVARANITHRENTNWVFVAGPFDVRITGTTFTLAWDAADQVLDLTLHEGSVEVASPLGASHIKVKTGQHFHASVTEGTMQLLAADAERAAPEAEAGQQLAAADQALAAEHSKAGNRTQRSQRGRAARVAHRRAKSAERRAARLADQDEPLRSDRDRNQDDQGATGPQLAAASYADLVRAGAFEQVVTAATQAGLARTLAHNSAEDVRALADAARYLHRTELAVRSLTVLRTRFPGSHHSAAAAFLLGRTYENAEQPQASRRFYELYERESPSGEFAAEALAGRMRTVASLEGESAGRAIAQQYLQRYPRGVHAKTARQLMAH